MTANQKVGIGVIGLGHWGPNHVRVFGQCAGSRVVIAADPAENRRRHVGQLYHDVQLSADFHDVLRHPEVEAVVIATPARTHTAITAAALESGKHVLLEKPMCQSSDEARRLLDLAQAKRRILVHGHVFLYNGGVRYVHRGLTSGDFGTVQYVHSSRTNLGPIRPDVNVVEDLATHELTIFDHLFGCMPTWVSAAGSCLLGTAHEDVAFVTLEYAGTLAHVHVSWLHPQKIRTMTVVGSRRMVVWNDMEPNEPIRVYDKGVVDEPYYDSFGEFQLRLRDADILIPKVNQQEPLKAQAEAFVRRITSGELTHCEAESGLRVVACLEAIQQSLKEDGRRVRVGQEAFA